MDWRNPKSAEPETPVVIILPGLTGGSQSDYVKGLVLKCQEICIRAVVFNNRGIGGIPLKVSLKLQLFCFWYDFLNPRLDAQGHQVYK